MAVTINSISKAAKVSKAVVSKVLNNRPDVAPETRKTVLRIIEELGYVPNTRARELSLGTNRDISIVLPSDNTVYMRLLFLIYRNLSSEGYNVAFHITDHDKEKERAVLYSLRAQPLQGLIYFVDPDGNPGMGEHLEKLNIPVVVLGGDGDGFDAFDQVYCHERDMAGELARMLRERGNDRIACFLMPEEKEYQKRRNGYMRSALLDAGFSGSGVVFSAARAMSADEGHRMMSLLPERDESFSICLLSNVFTGGVLRFLRERGALCGAGKGAFDVFTLGDASMFDELGLGYAYVSLPVEKLAGEASAALLRRMAQKDAELSVQRIPPFPSSVSRQP